MNYGDKHTEDSLNSRLGRLYGIERGLDCGPIALRTPQTMILTICQNRLRLQKRLAKQNSILAWRTESITRTSECSVCIGQINTGISIVFLLRNC